MRMELTVPWDGGQLDPARQSGRPHHGPRRTGRGLTGGDPGGLGVVPVLDAGDQLAAVLQRVPTYQRGLAPATPGRAEASGGKAKLRQDALLLLHSICSRSRAPEGTRGRCTQQPGAWGAPPGQTGGAVLATLPMSARLWKKKIKNKCNQIQKLPVFHQQFPISGSAPRGRWITGGASPRGGRGRAGQGRRAQVSKRGRAHLASQSGLLLEAMLDSEAQRRRGAALLPGALPGSCVLCAPPKPLVRPATQAQGHLSPTRRTTLRKSAPVRGHAASGGPYPHPAACMAETRRCPLSPETAGPNTALFNTEQRGLHRPHKGQAERTRVVLPSSKDSAT